MVKDAKRCRYCGSDRLNFTFSNFGFLEADCVICENCGHRGPSSEKCGTSAIELWNATN